MSTQSSFENIVVVGSLAYDQIMNLPGRFSDWIMPDKLDHLNISFTVNSMRRESGGTGGNCVYTLALHQLQPVLVSAAGKDANDYLAQLNNIGVDTAKVTINTEFQTASGHVITDIDNNQIWSFYPGPLVHLQDQDIKTISSNNSLLILMPSDPTAFSLHLEQAIKLKRTFLFDPAFFIPNLSKELLLAGLHHAHIVVGNEYEISLMEQRTGTHAEDWLTPNAIIITTLGAKGSKIQQGDTTYMIPAFKPRQLVDPTGAGDAYRAGFLAAYVQGKELTVCGQYASLSATYTVEHFGTQNHTFTPESFASRLEKEIAE